MGKKVFVVKGFKVHVCVFLTGKMFSLAATGCDVFLFPLTFRTLERKKYKCKNKSRGNCCVKKQVMSWICTHDVHSINQVH